MAPKKKTASRGKKVIGKKAMKRTRGGGYDSFLKVGSSLKVDHKAPASLKIGSPGFLKLGNK